MQFYIATLTMWERKKKKSAMPSGIALSLYIFIYYWFFFLHLFRALVCISVHLTHIFWSWRQVLSISFGIRLDWLYSSIMYIVYQCQWFRATLQYTLKYYKQGVFCVWLHKNCCVLLLSFISLFWNTELYERDGYLSITIQGGDAECSRTQKNPLLQQILVEIVTYSSLDWEPLALALV